MANYVFRPVDITLQDGKEITLKPLPLARLRRFMDAWGWFAKAEDDNDGFDVFINCAGIALEANFKGEFDTLKSTPAEQEEGQFLSEEYKSHLEEVLDLDTIYKILEVTGGIKLNDPNLLAAAVEAAQEQTENQ